MTSVYQCELATAPTVKRCVKIACRAGYELNDDGSCRQGKSNPGIGAATNQPTGNHFLIFRNGVKPRNQNISLRRAKSAAYSSLSSSHQRAIARRHERGADAVDVKASGAQIAIAGRDEPRERFCGVRNDRRFLRTVKPCRSGTRCWCQAGGGEIRLDRVMAAFIPPAGR